MRNRLTWAFVFGTLGAVGSLIGCGDDGSVDDGGVDGSTRDAPSLDGALRDAASRDAAEVPDGDVMDGMTADAAAVDATVDGGSVCEGVDFTPLVAESGDGELGAAFLDWRRSVVDDAHALSGGRAIRVRTRPGETLLPMCDGGHFFAGRSRLPAAIPQGSTVWFRVYQYIPSTFAMAYKYSRNAGDGDAAAACDQHADGNAWLKWLVMAPDMGTARVYLMPTVRRRSLEPSDRPRIRVISEALHRPEDAMAELPRDRWFALQMAVRVSSGEDGFIRMWIDDSFLGEVVGPTTVEDAALVQWGIGDYWNGVPWTDGEEGRTDFWNDEILVAADIEGYGAPTATDDGGRPYIPPCARVADLR